MSGCFHGTDRFYLEIEGVSTASFVRCLGLEARREVLEVAEGGRDRPRRVGGDLRFSTLVLQRGVTRGQELYRWFLEGDRRDGAVVLLGADGRESVRWRFSGAWPCRWEGPTLDAGRSEVALEELEIAHEGLEWIAR